MSRPRRQTRAFLGSVVGDDAPHVTPPALDLMEHLEEVMQQESMIELHEGAKHSQDPGAVALSMLAEMAGQEKVLTYLRQLIERARQVGQEAR